MKGSGVVSRSMREAIVGGLDGGGVAQGRLIDHGETEFLLPALFAFESLGDEDFRVTLHPGDRTAEQIEAATQAELDGRELSASTTVRVTEEQLVATFVDRGVGRVLLGENPAVVVHPPLFAVDRAGTSVQIQASPSDDDAATAGQLERELPGVLAGVGDFAQVEVTLTWPGESSLRAKVIDELVARGPAVVRLDDGTGARQVHPEIVRTFVDVLGRRPNVEPPLVMLGIDTDDLDGATAALASHLEEAAKSRVLVVFREGGRAIDGSLDNPVVQATRATLDATAKAVLQFRPTGAGGLAHFEVVSTSLEGLEVGARMKDPRGAR